MTIAVDRVQPVRVPWWRLPFTAITWRRTAYVLVATPVALFGVVAALAGRGRSAHALHHRLLDRLVGPSTDPARHPAAAPAPVGARVALFGLMSLPLNVGALVVTVYGWSIPPMNLFYPLRAGEPPLDAWGGPSLAGAWAVHVLGGVPFAFVTAFVRGLWPHHRPGQAGPPRPGLTRPDPSWDPMPPAGRVDLGVSAESIGHLGRQLRRNSKINGAGRLHVRAAGRFRIRTPMWVGCGRTSVQRPVVSVAVALPCVRR